MKNGPTHEFLADSRDTPHNMPCTICVVKLRFKYGLWTHYYYKKNSLSNFKIQTVLENKTYCITKKVNFLDFFYITLIRAGIKCIFGRQPSPIDCHPSLNCNWRQLWFKEYLNLQDGCYCIIDRKTPYLRTANFSKVDQIIRWFENETKAVEIIRKISKIFTRNCKKYWKHYTFLE